MQASRSDLKIRAKRLRAALKAILGVDATNSQTLELIAREESFPTWDAAAACAATEARPSSPRFLSLADITLQRAHVLLTGRTHSGKTALAREVAHVLAQQMRASGYEHVSVVLIAPVAEWDADTVLSPSSTDFSQQLEQLDFKRSVIVIDDLLDRGNGDAWLTLALKARAAVVTAHAGPGAQLGAGMRDYFQQIDCVVTNTH